MKAIIKNYDIQGNISLPASKSILHRALICASLASGTSKISNINLCNDIIDTINCIKALGAQININGNDIYVTGINNDFFNVKANIVTINESASTLRFMIPIFALCNTNTIINASSSLLKRPLDIFSELFTMNDNSLIINNHLQSKKYLIPGNVSSQFISGLLFALPLLEKDSIIEIEGELESKPYVDMTIQMLKTFGVFIQEMNGGYYISASQKYDCIDYIVESDYSQLAFYLALGSFNPLTINNITINSIQGDKAIINILQAMNAKISIQGNNLITSKSTLTTQVIDLKHCPDLGPVLIALASFIKGQTKFINIQRLRYKESNRIQAMIEELNKFSIKTWETDNELIIEGGNVLYTGEQLQCHNDHRICMALVLMALLVKNTIVINDVECISKSYPQFFADLKQISCYIELQ